MKACFLKLGSCVFSLLANVLDDDALYSRSDPSNLDVVEIEAKPQLYDRNSRLDSSCSKEDGLEALASYSNTRDIELNLETHKTLKRDLWTKKELTGICLRWNVAPGVQNIRISPCTFPVGGVT